MAKTTAIVTLTATGRTPGTATHPDVVNLHASTTTQRTYKAINGGLIFTSRLERFSYLLCLLHRGRSLLREKVP
jgi:hypothetical protein